MKTIIAYSKKAVNINDAHIEVEFEKVGDSVQFSDEHGTHSAKLIAIDRYPTEKAIGFGMCKITFENGNTVSNACVFSKK